MTSPAPATAPAFSALHVRLLVVALGLVALALSHLLRAFRPDQPALAELVAAGGLVTAGLPVFLDALLSLRADGFEATKYYMDQFVALAVLACLASGQYATGTVVAAILIIGQILEERTTLGVQEAVASLTRLARVPARRLGADDSVTLVDALQLRAGDRFRLLPGDSVPADGTIESGRTALDQASITGESLPVDAGPGTPVYAGTTNLSGAVTVTVTRTGDDTVLGRVTAIVEEAKNSRAPVMRLIDQYTRFYLPLVLILAGFVLFFTRDPQRAIAVVIVATPCAFVLASPAVMVAALAVASRLGLLVKSARFFETAPAIDTVVFDKTGTLTTGELRVTELRPADGVGATKLLAVAALLEAGSTHPVARAVMAEARRRELAVSATADVTETPGQGLASYPYHAGRRAWLEGRGVRLPPAEASGTALFVAKGPDFLGTIHFADILRPEASAAVAGLRAAGVDAVVMLTGDRPEVAAALAAETALDAHRAECLPEEKLAEVRALQAAGRTVLVVGDGVNDAPALAAGDLGVAMGALGSDVAIKTADVALLGNDLRHLPAFLALGRRALALINQNLAWGGGFIALFVVLSAAGWVSPITAAILHEFSAFFVIFNSARLLRFDPAAAG